MFELKTFHFNKKKLSASKIQEFLSKKNKIKTINKASIGDDDVLVMMVMMIIIITPYILGSLYSVKANRAEQIIETNHLNQT